MYGIDCVVGGGGGDYCEQIVGENIEVIFFFFYIQVVVGIQCQQMWIVVGFCLYYYGDVEDKDQCYCLQDGVFLMLIVYYFVEGEVQCCWDQEDCQYLYEIGQCGWVFKWMGGVGIEEIVVVSVQQFNCFL